MHIHSPKLSFFGTRGFADLSNSVDNGEFAWSESTMCMYAFNNTILLFTFNVDYFLLSTWWCFNCIFDQAMNPKSD